MKKKSMIIIVDFGSQTTHLIGRKIREFGIEISIVEPEEAISTIKKTKPQGIVLSGGPASVYGKGAPTISKEIFSFNIPILGICYGWQLISYLLGGKVILGHKEYGPAHLQITKQNPIYYPQKKSYTVWMSHGDTVKNIPEGFEIYGNTEDVKAAFVGDSKKNIYGLHFHPEIEHSECGKEFLKGFLINVCKLQITSKKPFQTKKIIKNLQKTIGDKKIICAVSGGVDSTVASFLIGKAVGKQLYPIYVDSGLNRAGTTELVKKIFNDVLGVKPKIINAKQLFLQKLKGITHGEEKRKIIGKLYIDIFQKQAKRIKNVAFLGQGTIYSDVIESKGTKNSVKIKSHHNVGGLPKKVNLTLIEPVRNYYKDEVRQLGLELGIPKDFVFQQKFPGPGYAIRIMGEVTAKRLKQLEKADSIVIEEIKKNGYYYKIFHSFAIMTGTYSVALKGDARAFKEVIGIRILEATEEMTANWAYLPHKILQRISSRIMNEVPDVSRIVYDITTKPPATMEWE